MFQQTEVVTTIPGGGRSVGLSPLVEAPGRYNSVLQEEDIRTRRGFDGIVGQCRVTREVLKAIEAVAPTDATVLLTGETGTGKELFARATHSLSARKSKPLVTVNCAALPAGLIESELFGHERGAFTGALSRKIGRFELAHRGTIFLDEIGELPLELQTKLLRVLQEGEFERVGGSQTIKADVRVIAATNREMPKAIEEGKFREDLYYRLSVFPVEIPPLRERREDIPALVSYFVSKYGRKLGRTPTSISQPTNKALMTYRWPGNVRELENVIERAVILSRAGRLELEGWPPKSVATSVSGGTATLAEHERKHISSVLERTGWRVSGEKGAAKILDINPSTLVARMKKLGIVRGAEL